MEGNKVKLKVGVIGCGRISVMHLDAINTLECAELVCCCDIKKDRADVVAKQYGVKAYYDYKQMIESVFGQNSCVPLKIRPVGGYELI